LPVFSCAASLTIVNGIKSHVPVGRSVYIGALWESNNQRQPSSRSRYISMNKGNTLLYAIGISSASLKVQKI